MPEKTLNEVFSEIADAIREKSESSETIKPINMAAAIEEIPTGPQFHNTLVSFSDGNEYWSLQPYNSSFLLSKPADEYSGDSSDVEIVGDYEGAGVYYYSTSTSPGQLRILHGDYFDKDGRVLDFDEGALYYYQGDSGGLEVDEPINLDWGAWYSYKGETYFTLIDNPPSEDGYYRWDSGSSRFSPKISDGLYQILNSEAFNISLTINNYYQYTIDGEGHMEFTPYTPGPTPEKGKYYYGNALTSQTLAAGVYQFVDNNTAMSQFNLTAGSTYTWNGHSFIPYS